MQSNNIFIAYKKHLSFINRCHAVIFSFLLMLIVFPVSYLVFSQWNEMPLGLRLLSPALLATIFFGIVALPTNGMLIMKKDGLIFFPDVRIKKVNADDLLRIAVIFNQWNNKKYSATIKFVYKDGRVYVKDFSKQFRNMRNKNGAMLVYTISSKQVNKIIDSLSDCAKCVITVIDYEGHIVFQRL